MMEGQMMHQELKKNHEWNMADTVTTVRMGASVFLLFLSFKTIWFLIFYTFAGLTDVLDGWLARKTGRASEFGARLDSIAGRYAFWHLRHQRRNWLYTFCGQTTVQTENPLFQKGKL